MAAVLLHSPHPERLAAFYRERLGVPLEPMALPDFPPHYACEVGQVYFAVMPGEGGLGSSPACVAFHVEDVASRALALEEAGVPCDFPPRRTSLGFIARFRDPDGNLVELYQP